MTYFKWLQYFADGDGGEGAAATGDGAAAAEQALRDRGVPENAIRKYGRNVNVPKAADVQQPQEQAQEQVAAAENTETSQKEDVVAPKYDYDEVMKDPEINKRVQTTVKEAKKKVSAQLADAEGRLNAAMPILQHLAREHGMNPDNIDMAALGKAVTGYYDQRAAELGTSVEVAMQMDQQKTELERQKMFEHAQNVQAQADKLKELFPSFDLQTEMQNPTFVQLTSPGLMSVEDAYRHIHRAEIEKAIADTAAENTRRALTNNIRAGNARPVEAGASRQPPSTTIIDWSNATDAQVKAKLAEIRNRGR